MQLSSLNMTPLIDMHCIDSKSLSSIHVVDDVGLLEKLLVLDEVALPVEPPVELVVLLPPGVAGGGCELVLIQGVLRWKKGLENGC